MRACYFDAATRSIADLVKMDDQWVITRINVPKAHRGLGYARGLLRRIIFDADCDGTDLSLDISPSDGLSYKQLAAWYQRHGFVPTGDGVYRRVPCVTRIAVTIRRDDRVAMFTITDASEADKYVTMASAMRASLEMVAL